MNHHIANPDVIRVAALLHVPAETASPAPPPPSQPDPVAWFDFAGAQPNSDLTLATGNHDLAPFFHGCQPTSAQDWTWGFTTLHDGFIRIKHRKGRKGPGLQMETRLDKPLPAALYQWTFMMEDPFDWGHIKQGGKFGGVRIGARGGRPSNNKDDRDIGGSVRLTFKENGEISVYVYDQLNSGYGRHHYTGAFIEPGRKHSAELAVDVDAGTIRASLAGAVIHESHGHPWPDADITAIGTSIFHGGGTHEFGPAFDCWSRLYSGNLWPRTHAAGGA
jgi:hypothetical protein